jgi:hypothetical protein
MWAFSSCANIYGRQMRWNESVDSSLQAAESAVKATSQSTRYEEILGYSVVISSRQIILATMRRLWHAAAYGTGAVPAGELKA